MSKEKLLRLLQIIESTDEQTPMNASQLAERLEDMYRLEGVDRRTVYRDITLFQDCGYPIKQAPDRRNGWYMDKHPFEDWEIKMMMDAIQQAKCLSVEEANGITEKLLALTSNRGRSRFARMMRPVVAGSQVTVAVGEYVELMMEAMYQQRKIEFQYTEISNSMEKVLRQDGKAYRLNLYAIYWSNNTYYLIGARDNYNQLSHYRLDRIVNMRMTRRAAVDVREKVGQNPELYIQKYIEKSVYHFSGDIVRIEVVYNADLVTNAILYEFAGKKITVIKQMDGTYKASFRKMNSVALVGWFLQYANRFRVLRPEGLKNDIIQAMENGLKTYGR